MSASPAVGETSEVLASTGLLHRVLAISDLDFGNPASFELANVLVNEAIDMQRSSRGRNEATPMDLDELEAGQAFGPYVIEISQPDADAYIAATGDSKEPHDFAGNMHPLQLDAYVLSRLIAEIGIVENRIETVHAGQQMTVHRQATPAKLSSLIPRSRVAQTVGEASGRFSKLRLSMKQVAELRNRIRRSS